MQAYSGSRNQRSQLQHTVWPVADCSTNHAAMSMITLLIQELSYQPKLHQLMCYHLKQPCKTLICIYTTNAGSRGTGCIALAAEIRCYCQERQDVAGGHVRNLLYNECTSGKISLLFIGHKNHFQCKKGQASPVVHSMQYSPFQQSSPCSDN